MIRRKFRRHARRHPILTAAAVFFGLILIASIGAHLMELLILATIGVIVYAIGRNRQPVVRATIRRGPAVQARSGPGHAAQLAAVSADRDRLAAELARTQASLAEARESAQAAWDAAADRPPTRRVTGDTIPLDVLDAERLTAMPMSGVRPLGPR